SRFGIELPRAYSGLSNANQLRLWATHFLTLTGNTPLVLTYMAEQMAKTERLEHQIKQQRITPPSTTASTAAASMASMTSMTFFSGEQPADPATLYATAITCAHQGNYQMAISVIQQALPLFAKEKGEISKECADCLAKLTSCYLASQDYDNAEATCIKAYKVM